MHIILSVLLFYLIPSTLAALQTVRVDDAATGQSQAQFRYLPPNQWQQASGSGGGRAAPDAGRAHKGTWHDATHDTDQDKQPTTLEISFTGTGIQLFCIMANDLGSLIGTHAKYSFVLDDQPAGNFFHKADPTRPQFEFDFSVFKKDGLSNSNHKLRVNVDGGAGIDGSSLILFDYAEVQFEDGIAGNLPLPTADGQPTPSPSPTPTQSQKENRVTGASFSRTSSRVTTVVVGGETATITEVNGEPQTNQDQFPEPTSSDTPLGATAANPKKVNTGAIVGGVLGALILLALVGFLFWIQLRRRKMAAHRKRMEDYYFPTPSFPTRTVSMVPPPHQSMPPHPSDVPPLPPPPPRNETVERWVSQQNPFNQYDPNPSASSLQAAYSHSVPEPGKARPGDDAFSQSQSSEGGTRTMVRELRREVAELREVLQLRNLQQPSAITQ